MMEEAIHAGTATAAKRLDVFMAEANALYYAKQDPFADFTTAPEISQIFGELLGAWAICAWRGMGGPGRLLLVEAGPGRGTLMQDALRCARRVAPEFAAVSTIHFIETSPRLRKAQAARVPGATWHETLATLPDGPMVLLANEFLDALPVRQFVGHNDGWRERHVLDGRFVEYASEGPGGIAAEDGAVVEVSQACLQWMQSVAARVCEQEGAALIVDYGTAEPARGESLQALRGGRFADPLKDAGCADLTAHVDFLSLAREARACGARVHGPASQGDFLLRLGIKQRLEALCAANPLQAVALGDAVNRLIAPARMGSLFKAMAVSHPVLNSLPGFQP